jgi:hypothetical protein
LGDRTNERLVGIFTYWFWNSKLEHCYVLWK